MKSLKIYFLLPAVLLGMNTMAQQTIKEPVVKTAALSPDDDEYLIVPIPPLVKADTIKKEIEQLAREYTPTYKHQPGEINLLPFFEQVPTPVNSLPAARNIDEDHYYDPFIDRMKTFQKQLAEEARKNSTILQLYDKGGKPAVEKAFKQEANESDLIRQMGGVDKIQNMNEAQRKALATKIMNENAIIAQMGGVNKIHNMSESERKTAAMNAVKQNPNAVTPNNDPVLQAFMQKMKADPKYAALYKNMSINKQQEEYRQFSIAQSGIDPFFNDHEKEDREFEATMAKRSIALDAIAIQKLLIRIKERLENYTAPIIIFQQKCDEYMKQLRATSFGIEGYYQVAKVEARINAVIWDLYKNAYKYSIGEFNDFVGNHWGETDFSRGDLSDTNLQIAAAIGSVYEGLINIAEDAKKQTRGNKSKQLYYENNR
ncbi:MAG: hypothetical protein WDN26_12890 [Chitinophagaceae bacterium]